jgi:hypothetical protein
MEQEKITGFKAKDLLNLYNDRSNYESLEELDYMSKDKTKAMGLPFFNGIFARNFLKGNSKEGWIEIAALNDAGCFGKPVAPPFFMSNNKKDLITATIKGDVYFVKCNSKGEPKKRLIVVPNAEQVKKATEK